MNLENDEIPFGKRDFYQQKMRRCAIKNEMDHYKIKLKKRPKIKDPITLSKYNELEFESLSRFTKRCDDFSSLDHYSDPILKKSHNNEYKYEENEIANNEEMIRFIHENSQDFYPPKYKRYKVSPPSFTISYHERVSKHIYPLPVNKSPKHYSIPKIETKIPDSSIIKTKMKQYLIDKGEILTSYLK